MNGFNRVTMILIALVLLVAPVFLLLVAFGFVPADVVSSYVDYRSAIEALGNTSLSDFDGRNRAIVAVVAALVVLIAFILLLRELTFGPRVTRSTLVDNTPGREVRITARAVSALVESAALEAGAATSSSSLTSKGHLYVVDCAIQAPQASNFVELATRVRDNIRQALDAQNVPVRDIEVTVRETTT